MFRSAPSRMSATSTDLYSHLEANSDWLYLEISLSYLHRLFPVCPLSKKPWRLNFQSWHPNVSGFFHLLHKLPPNGAKVIKTNNVIYNVAEQTPHILGTAKFISQITDV